MFKRVNLKFFIFFLKLTIFGALVLLGFNQNIFATGGEVNQFQITSKVISAALQNPTGNYLNWGMHGVCFWLNTEGFYPKIETTAYIDQFTPDAVVSVYNQGSSNNPGRNTQNSNPWLFAQNIIDPAMQTAGDAFYQTIEETGRAHAVFSGSGSNSAETFKEVDIIGDPALFIFNRLPFLLIPSNAWPNIPYYSSLFDSYFWTHSIKELFLHPQGLIPFYDEEGSVFNQWGSMYPHTGYINQSGDYKAAAVIALRGADIATNGVLPHLLKPSFWGNMNSKSCGHDCDVWGSKVNDFKNVKFQEIYPKSDTTAKARFGSTGVTTYGQSQLAKGKGNYVWVMWRHYRGCIQNDGDYLGKATW